MPFQDDCVAAAQHELRELRNSISHLERSNAELRSVVREDPDPEFVVAIEENVATIRKLHTRAEEISQLLRAGSPSHCVCSRSELRVVWRSWFWPVGRLSGV